MPFSKLSLIITLITVSGTPSAVNGVLISLCHELLSLSSDLSWLTEQQRNSALRTRVRQSVTPAGPSGDVHSSASHPELPSEPPKSCSTRWVVGVRAGPDLSQNKPQREGVRIFSKETGYGGGWWRVVRVKSQSEHSFSLALSEIFIFGMKWGATWPCWLLSIPFPREVFLWDLSLRAKSTAGRMLLKPVHPTVFLHCWGCVLPQH